VAARGVRGGGYLKRLGSDDKQRVAKQANMGCSVRRVEMEHGGRRRPIAGAAAYSVDAGGDRTKAARAGRAAGSGQRAGRVIAGRQSHLGGGGGGGACLRQRRRGRPRTKRAKEVVGRVCGWRRVPRCIQASSSAPTRPHAPSRPWNSEWRMANGEWRMANGHGQLQV
jgi:hypothetical protein